MIVRKAIEKDIPELMVLLDQVNLVHHLGRPDLFKHATKYTVEELKAVLSNPGTPVFVAVGEGASEAEEVILGHGFCVFQQAGPDHNIFTDIKTLYIDDICVDERARGKHVGQAIYDHILGFAREENCYNVTLNVWAFNEGARDFYEAMGMKPQKYGMEVIL